MPESRRTGAPHLQTQAHRIFRSEDVVAKLCRHLGPSELTRLMRTSKSFKPVAQNELWRAHATLEALLFTLPSSTFTRGFFGSPLFRKPPRPSDWTEPRRFAAMIQILDQPPLPLLMRAAMLLVMQTLVSNGPTTSGSSIFCPQITALSWNAEDSTQINAAKMFTSPTLKHLRLNLGGVMEYDSNVLDGFVEHVALTSTNLEGLEIVSSVPATLSVDLNPTSLAGCTNLRSINLHISLNSESLLKCLSNLPHLHTLRGHVSTQRPPEAFMNYFNLSISGYLHTLPRTRVTFGSLHTLGLKGASRSLSEFISKVNAPRLSVIDIDIDSLTSDEDFTQFCHSLSQRVNHVSYTRLALTNFSTIDVSSLLKHYASIARELVIQSYKLSLTTIDSDPTCIQIERLTLLTTTGWKQALPLSKLLDLLQKFPSLKYLEVGIDASNFRDLSHAFKTYSFPLEKLTIYPGPIQVAWPVASFLGSILPSAQISIQSVTGRAGVWDEVVGAVPELQRSVLVERRTTALEQENAQLRIKLEQQGSAFEKRFQALERELRTRLEQESVAERRSKALEQEITRLRTNLEEQDSVVDAYESLSIEDVF